VRAAAESAAQSLYLSPPPGTPAAACDVRVAGQLMALLEGATVADLASLQQLLGLALAAGHVPSGVVDVLWKTFALALPDASEHDARRAAELIAMLAASDASVVASRLPLITSLGLGPRWRNEPALALASAVACRRAADGGVCVCYCVRA
jgi:hypothetical protein